MAVWQLVNIGPDSFVWWHPETGEWMPAISGGNDSGGDGNGGNGGGGGNGNGSQVPPTPAPPVPTPPKDTVPLPVGVRAADGGVLTSDTRISVEPTTGKLFRTNEDGSVSDFGALRIEDLNAVKAQIGLAPPPRSESESGLDRALSSLVDLATADFQRQSAFLADLMPSFKGFFESQAKLSVLSAESAARLIPLQEEIFRNVAQSLVETPDQKEIRELGEQRTLAFLRGEAPPISEGRAKLIETEFGEARRRGEQDIRRFGEELASARGLRLTDTPIGQEVLRAETDLTERLRAGEAGARLTEGSVEEQRMLAVAQFQQNLAEQARQNRFGLLLGQNLGGQVPPLPTVSAGSVLGPAVSGQLGLGGLELGRADLFQTGQLGRERIAADINIANIQADAARFAARRASKGNTLSGFGSILSGVAKIAPFFISSAVSSARLKRDVMPLDQHDEALKKIRKTPLFRYRYRWEQDEDRAPHIGPILEMSPPEIREDAWRINLGDYAGLTHAAVKALDRKVEQLQRRLAERVA